MIYQHSIALSFYETCDRAFVAPGHPVRMLARTHRESAKQTVWKIYTEDAEIVTNRRIYLCATGAASGIALALPLMAAAQTDPPSLDREGDSGLWSQNDSAAGHPAASRAPGSDETHPLSSGRLVYGPTHRSTRSARARGRGEKAGGVTP
jgi:hypothetical protein